MVKDKILRRLKQACDNAVEDLDLYNMIEGVWCIYRVSPERKTATLTYQCLNEKDLYALFNEFCVHNKNMNLCDNSELDDINNCLNNIFSNEIKWFITKTNSFLMDFNTDEYIVPVFIYNNEGSYGKIF